MSSEPTLGEVIRRLEDVSRQLADLARELKDDRAQAAATYVRQDVYVAQRLADQAVVADLHGDIRTVKADRASDLGWRRQMWLAIGGLAVTTMLAIVGFIINYTGSR